MTLDARFEPKHASSERSNPVKIDQRWAVADIDSDILLEELQRRGVLRWEKTGVASRLVTDWKFIKDLSWSPEEMNWSPNE